MNYLSQSNNKSESYLPSIPYHSYAIIKIHKEVSL